MKREIKITIENLDIVIKTKECSLFPPINIVLDLVYELRNVRDHNALRTLYSPDRGGFYTQP